MLRAPKGADAWRQSEEGSGNNLEMRSLFRTSQVLRDDQNTVYRLLQNELDMGLRLLYTILASHDFLNRKTGSCPNALFNSPCSATNPSLNSEAALEVDSGKSLGVPRP